MFAPDSVVTVYHKNEWWKDDWDALDYGRDYDFNRPFFEQFAELNKKVPHMHVLTLNDENSDYTNYNTDNKNCYLCFAGNYSEYNLYCYNAQSSKFCVDCLFIWNCEVAYECLQCDSCYECFYCSNSKNCHSSMFLDDCLSCNDCFMCANLRNKKYCILNKQYSQEEYFKKKDEFLARGHKECVKIWKEERQKFPVKASHNSQSEDCRGEYIWQSKNCKDCYIMAKGGEDCRDVFNGFPDLKDSRDCTFCGEKAELMYESLASGVNGSRVSFGNLVLEGCNDILYSSFIFGCKNCFGCSNMRQKQYCVLNKQYNKDEYEVLLPRIIGHMRETGEWGEYFSTESSLFGYNESFADLYFPMSKEEILSKNWKWREKREDIGGEVSGDVQKCEKSGIHFRFVKQELKFYEKWKIPIPNLCFEERNKARMARMNGWEVKDKKCSLCGEDVKTNSISEKVFCEKCYLEEVY